MKAGRFNRNHRLNCARGFSMVEVVIVVAIVVILAAMAVPQVLTMVHTFRLHNASTEFTSIVQQARMRSVRDSKAYPVLYTDKKPITEAYVDIKGNGSLDTVCSSAAGTDCDPMVTWNDEVTPFASSSAQGAGVDVAGLQTLVLAGASSTGVTFLDGFAIGTTPITFSPMGIPCVSNGTICNTATTSAKESNTVVAYYMFFEDSVSKKWEAVTITPAGKIQKWQYSGKSWVQL